MVNVTISKQAKEEIARRNWKLDEGVKELTIKDSKNHVLFTVSTITGDMEARLGRVGTAKVYYVDRVEISTTLIAFNLSMSYENRKLLNDFNEGKRVHITVDMLIIYGETPERTIAFIDSDN